MKTLILLLVAFAGTTASGATLTDLELQSKLESFYSQKIRQMDPNLRFSISVHLAPLPEMKLDLFDDAPAVDSGRILIQDRIRSVDLSTETPVDAQAVAKAFELPPSLIHLSSLTPSKSLSFFKTVSGYVSKPEGFLQGMQLSLFALMMIAALAAIVVFRKSMASVANRIQSSSSSANAGASELALQRKNREEPGATRDPARSFADSQLRAMLAECYWTFHDAEAAALIRAYPKIEAYSELRFGAAYVEYLKHVNPSSFDFVSDVYFLHPNPIFLELSVEDTPLEALSKTSQFRFEAKNADALELISIQASAGKDFAFEAFVVKASPLRKLRPPIRVRFRTVTEEHEVLSNDAISDEIKQNLPSLYRLTALSNDEFEAVIRPYSLNDLARAWIAPDWVLEKLEQKMNERKRILFNEIKPRITPSRQSEVFQALISFTHSSATPLIEEEKIAA